MPSQTKEEEEEKVRSGRSVCKEAPVRIRSRVFDIKNQNNTECDFSAPGYR